MKTISDAYKKANQKHHKECLRRKTPWGGSVVTLPWFETIVKIAKKHEVVTILDYGAGRGVIASKLRRQGYRVTEYDPGVKGKTEKPQGTFDMVISLDVFEHVEDNYIENALDEVQAYMDEVGFFTISTRRATHVLPGGYNAHQTVQEYTWWRRELVKRFKLLVEAEGRGKQRSVSVQKLSR